MEDDAGFQAFEEYVPPQGSCRPVIPPLEILRPRVQDLGQKLGAVKGVAETFGRAGTDPARGLAEQDDFFRARGHLPDRLRPEQEGSFSPHGFPPVETVVSELFLQQLEFLHCPVPGRQCRPDDGYVIHVTIFLSLRGGGKENPSRGAGKEKNALSAFRANSRPTVPK